MSRSGYSEDCDDMWQMIRWSGAVKSAIRGKRGQQFLKDLVLALEAMPEKRLIVNDLENEGGVCAIGALGKSRGMDMSMLDPENPEQVAMAFGVSPTLVREIVYHNDEEFWPYDTTPEKRWELMLAWAKNQLTPTEASHD